MKQISNSSPVTWLPELPGIIGRTTLAYRLLTILYLLPAVCVFFSCSTAADEQADERARLILKIDSIGKNMFNPANMEFDPNLATKGINAFNEFIQKFPNDTLVPEYLFRMSDLYRASGNYSKAIEALSEICNRHKNYQRVPESLFLQGFYYQEYLKDTASARQYYRELILKYPNHDFADDARVLLTKTEEEILKSIEQNNP